ncbi:MAG: ammonia-dependent NAD(+) synthetase [Gallicola sp.]|nr:ammonia-dependent NAD(+) synthetase [Gallicola sp.]
MNTQEKIIQRLKVKPLINPSEEIRISIDFIKDYFKKHPFFKSCVLGISGGQDSTLVGKLAQMAVEELREEGYETEFLALRLPYGNQADEVDALKAVDYISPDKTFTVNIKDSVDKMVSAFVLSGQEISDYNKGNIKARARMTAQYALAGEYKGIVLGTDHAAENITGFFTKHGDGAADIMPIWRLNKRQGKALLKELNCPKELYEKIPTADLEEEKPMIADETALGITYEEIDDYLEGKEIPEESRKKLEAYYKNSEHKRQMPVTLYDEWWK